VIAQSLVVKHQHSDFVRELFALPSALLTAGLFALGFKSRRLDGSNRIRCSAEFVRGNMRDHRRLARGICCVPS